MEASWTLNRYGSSHFPKIREKSSLINSKKNFYRGNEAQNYWCYILLDSLSHS